jgi:hypothetical protein
VTIGPSSQANQGEVHSSLDQSFNDSGAKSNKKGKIHKITTEIEDKQAKLEKTDVKIADLKKRVIEVESMIRSEESLEKEYLKWQGQLGEVLLTHSRSQLFLRDTKNRPDSYNQKTDEKPS